MLSTTKQWTGKTLIAALAAIVGGLVLGLGVGATQPVQASGNCAPGYPVCWFSASCGGQCEANFCDSYVCDAAGSEYLDCYVCVYPE